MAHRVPSFIGIRLARLADIPRIGLVAAAGFYHSNQFPYVRPGYNEFPCDTLANYRTEYSRMIIDSSSIVIVAEEPYEESEVDKVYAALQHVYPAWNNPTEKAIVAVCSIRLPPNSSRTNQFQPEGPNPPPLRPDPEDLKRDRDARADKLFDKYTAEPEARLLQSKFEISTQVTHPAYWGRGHGARLAKWALELADIDEVATGVAAATMGVPFFSHLGFELDEVVEVKGYERHPESITVWIGTRGVPDANAEL